MGETNRASRDTTQNQRRKSVNYTAKASAADEPLAHLHRYRLLRKRGVSHPNRLHHVGVDGVAHDIQAQRGLGKRRGYRGRNEVGGGLVSLEVVSKLATERVCTRAKEQNT